MSARETYLEKAAEKKKLTTNAVASYLLKNPGSSKIQIASELQISAALLKLDNFPSRNLYDPDLKLVETYYYA